MEPSFASARGFGFPPESLILSIFTAWPKSSISKTANLLGSTFPWVYYWPA